MAVRFRVPDLGEGVVETEIVRWLVRPGQEITEDEPMVEVMTDKATVEIPAPASGVVTDLLAAEGDVVPVGTVIVEIDGPSAAGPPLSLVPPVDDPVQLRAVPDAPDGGPGAAPPLAGDAPHAAGEHEPAPTQPATKVQATPLVRRLAGELGVDLATVHGTGPGGRITEADVRSVADGTNAPVVELPSAARQRESMRQADETDGVAMRVPLRGVRRAIAEHLQRAASVPTVTVVEEVDLTAVEEARYKADLGYLPFIARAVFRGLAEVPELNATLDDAGEELVIYDRVDLGVAVQTEQGLLVPVLRDCSGWPLDRLNLEVEALATAAREGTLEPAQLRGGTFTITSAGKLGGLFTTPLLNVPQVAILGVHRASDRPMAVGGEVVIRRMANLSITFDHRAVDGVDASRFLLVVADALQRPLEL